MTASRAGQGRWARHRHAVFMVCTFPPRVCEIRFIMKQSVSTSGLMPGGMPGVRGHTFNLLGRHQSQSLIVSKAVTVSLAIS